MGSTKRGSGATGVLMTAYLLCRTMCRGENSILGQLKAEGKNFIPLLCVVYFGCCCLMDASITHTAAHAVGSWGCE